MEKTVIVNSEEETAQLARDLLPKLPSRLILLRGELGSGKTAFIRGLGAALGLNRVPSPTYTIIRSYQLKKPLEMAGQTVTAFHHVDLYRLTSPKEVEALGLAEIIDDPHNLVAIEWPEILAGRLRQPQINISFQILEGDKRQINIR